MSVVYCPLSNEIRLREIAERQLAEAREALQEAGNANGTPIASYYSPEVQLKYHHERTDKVARIIEEALRGEAGQGSKS